jgi:uncharacterized protein (TIGR02145 family)
MRNLALMWVLAGCLLGCGGKPSDTTFTDKRDGKVYKIVKIGRQVWFAENLNYAAKWSRCYEDSPDSCAKYGRLYGWEAALKACPAGTHLPTNEEWATLVDYVGGDSTAGIKLKSSTGWHWYGDHNIADNGTDDYGFSALPGGCGIVFDGDAADVGGTGCWWSATDDGADVAWGWTMQFYDELVYKDVSLNFSWHSVRCVLDNGNERRK